MAPGGGGDRSVEQTPTWAVAGVFAVFVIISIIIEHGIHSLAKWFHKRHKKEMVAALEKIKAELMLMGFISLLLTVGTSYVAKICIPEKVGNTMLPCTGKYDKEKVEEEEGGKGENDRRRLLWFASSWRRHLAAAASDSESCDEGKVGLISQSALHQLHIFIFVLAFFHILYSVITMLLAKAKMKKWKSWELETTSLEYEYTHDPARFRLAHQTSFVRRHSGLSTTPGMRWVVAFFRQFFGSVSKVDYLTMRHGFINAHFAPNTKFDFHKYIKRSMEDDFKRVVGISFPLWVFAALYLLVNKDEWHTLAWLAFVPFIILVIVGTKLEVIIMEMAQEIEDRNTVVRGAPLVEPSNKFFWFNRPQWVLFLIHLTLFQNAFQLAFFLWAWYEYGLGSCFHDHENTLAMSVRVFLGLGLQILCSYITFPLYALVTQMGSEMKRGIFEEQTTRALKNWHKAARERNKMRNKVEKGGGGGDASPSGYTSGEATPSIQGSPMHLLHKYKQRERCSQPEVLDHNNNSDAECSASEPDINHPSTSSSTPPPPPHNHNHNHNHYVVPLQSHNNINFSSSKPPHTS